MGRHKKLRPKLCKVIKETLGIINTATALGTQRSTSTINYSCIHQHDNGYSDVAKGRINGFARTAGRNKIGLSLDWRLRDETIGLECLCYLKGTQKFIAIGQKPFKANAIKCNAQYEPPSDDIRTHQNLAEAFPRGIDLTIW